MLVSVWVSILFPSKIENMPVNECIVYFSFYLATHSADICRKTSRPEGARQVELLP